MGKISKPADLAGQSWDDLKVISYAGFARVGACMPSHTWLISCSCGEDACSGEFIVRQYALTQTKRPRIARCPAGQRVKNRATAYVRNQPIEIKPNPMFVHWPIPARN